MTNPTKRALRTIGALALKHSLSLKNTNLGGRNVRIHTLYAGGANLLHLTESVDIAFVQCGAGGNWLALLPAEALMQLLGTENAFDNSKKERN